MNTGKAVARLTKIIRHLALAREHNYRTWLRGYCDYLKGLRSHLSSEQKLERFLSALAQKDVAASTQNQAFNAIAFPQRCSGLELKDVLALRARRATKVRRPCARD
jgi:hypothetical protein